MKKEVYEKDFIGGVLKSCMPIALSRIGFILKILPNADKDETFEDTAIKLIVYLPEKNDLGDFAVATWVNNIANLELSAYERSWIVCDQYFQLCQVKHTGWYQMPNNENGQLCQGMANIDGEVYAYGMLRSVFKRTSLQEWDNITAKAKHPNLFADLDTLVDQGHKPSGGDFGFSAMDGFGGDDIYAGGNNGDFWHFHQQQWRKKILPLNSDISSITCGSDGIVYLGCRTGPVLAGRDDNWQTIDDSKEITGGAWFQDRIYFSSRDGRVYTHDEGESSLEEASFTTDFPSYMLHLIRGVASCDECLVVYTSKQAYAYDGKEWHEIIEIPSLSKHNNIIN